MSNIFFLVAGEAFVSVIGNKYVNSCSALNFVDAINYVYVQVCARAQSISQHVDIGSLNVPPQLRPNLTRVTLN